MHLNALLSQLRLPSPGFLGALSQKSHSLVLSPEQTLVFLLHLQQPVFQQFYLSLWQVPLGLLQDDTNSSAKQCCVQPQGTGIKNRYLYQTETTELWPPQTCQHTLSNLWRSK